MGVILCSNHSLEIELLFDNSTWETSAKSLFFYLGEGMKLSIHAISDPQWLHLDVDGHFRI